MQITIDTQKDSKEELKKIVDLLNEILGEETKEEKESSSPTPISTAEESIEKQIAENDSDDRELLKNAPKIEIIADDEDLLGNKISHHEKKKEKKGLAQDILDATRFFSDDGSDEDKNDMEFKSNSKDKKKKDNKPDNGVIVY